MGNMYILVHLGIITLIGIAACNKNCSTTEQPVCSSNGIIYSSLCEFEKAKSNNSDLVRRACPEACLKNCSNEKVSKICASTGQTFNNLCEFEKQKCLLKMDNWIVIYENECATLPPLKKEASCHDHETKIFMEDRDEYNSRCLNTMLSEKAMANNLTFDDIKDCYIPTCERNGQYYHHRQCALLHEVCWCARRDGSFIPNTFAPLTRVPECSAGSCTVNNKLYKNEEEVKYPDTCGKCKCLDGNVTCSLKYNTTLPLSDDQITLLKNDILQLFYYRNAYPKVKKERLDVIHADEHSHNIDSAVKRSLLKTRFDNYDKDNSYSLSKTEMSIFKVDFHEFTHCSEFITLQLFDIMDSNNDKNINIREWGNFFEVENLSRRKRSLLDRHADRRKFKYTLF